LAGYKRPKAIRFIGVDELPRSTTGKIQRHELEKWLSHGEQQFKPVYARALRAVSEQPRSSAPLASENDVPLGTVHASLARAARTGPANP
jgi:hypothetical protein